MNTLHDEKTNTCTDTNVADCITGTHTLVLHNDDFNTFEFVIKNLVKICKHQVEQATQCAFLVHYTGKTDIMHGEFSELNACKTALTDQGLSATIEHN
ncbi:MAG: ATP-dependent Clp protease adaptor ClpS [Bacteroidales bacterium]|jgi:ATP-dependent Clp protease adaptor protein ClpS|nr:ATP-dependent Clp protease adaptor ClpS [Bacteroidales bacterium]